MKLRYISFEDVRMYVCGRSSRITSYALSVYLPSSHAADSTFKLTCAFYDWLERPLLLLGSRLETPRQTEGISKEPLKEWDAVALPIAR